MRQLRETLPQVLVIRLKSHISNFTYVYGANPVSLSGIDNLRHSLRMTGFVHFVAVAG